MKSILTTIASLFLLAAGPCDEKADLPPETFWQKVGRIAGLSANPSAHRGPDDRVEQGDVYLWTPGPPAIGKRLTRDGGYRSPIFRHGDQHVLALRGERLVRLTPGDAGADVTELFPVPGVVKLVGASQDDEQLVLVLHDHGGHRRAAFLCLHTGRVVGVDDAASPRPRDEGDDARMVHLVGWTREYGTTRVETHVVRGTSNVHLLREGKDPVDVSQCGDVHCGQPSLSFAGDRVVFVKASTETP